MNYHDRLHYSPLKENETCHFHFISPKTKSSERNILLLPELEKVFKPIVKANIQEKEMAKYEGREAFALEEFSPHCFRHTFITRCREQGILYEIIQAFVGHSTAKTTMGYDHYKPELDLSGLSKIQFLNVV